MIPELEIVYPDGRKERLQLTRQRTVIGRSSDAHVQIADNRISRQHCAVEVEGNSVYIVDLGGSNGTWIGKTKLLANVREPFPREAIVHVGPARLQRVDADDRGAARDQLESQVYRPTPPRRSGGRAAGRRRGGGNGDVSAAVDLEQSRLTLAPGERADLQLHISNQGKTVDHYTVVATGVPSSWVTLPRGGLELLPRQDGTLNVAFHPPRSARASAGVHRVTVAVKNQAGRVVSEAEAEVEVKPFHNLVLDIRPNPYTSRMGGTMTLTVENQGNAMTDYRVDVIDPSDALQITVEPPRATLAPQQERQNQIHLHPRKRNWIGSAKRMPLTVTVSTDQQSVDVMPVYNQLATIPRWLPVIFSLLCCVIIPFLAVLSWQPIVQPVMFPTETPAPTVTPSVTPSPTVDIAATTTAEWCAGDQDGDRLRNCQEEELGTEPGVKDTDGDGLDDFVEVREFGTDPLNFDTDGDGLRDGDEVNFPCPAGGVLSPNNPDTDGDGVPDGSDPEPCAAPTRTPEAPTPVPNFAFGGHMRGADDDAAFAAMDEARMDWVKIQVRFSPGANPASTTEDILKIKENGYNVLVGLVGNREDIARGGGYFQEYAAFAGQLAAAADAIEVWNEPNLDREWPTGQINPATYVELLRGAYQQIKATNPRVLVISAAPAPTGANGEGVMDDARYINGMIGAGALNYMDCAGAHFNAGATPPAETSGHPADDGQGHHSWYFLKLLDVYWDTFNSGGEPMPICFTEFGFVSPEGFGQTLVQAGAVNFTWAEGIDEFEQAVWLSDALQRSCLSGKVRMFIVWNINFTGDLGQDPQAGYAIIRPDESCPACARLAEAVSALRVAGCMQ